MTYELRPAAFHRLLVLNMIVKYKDIYTYM